MNIELLELPTKELLEKIGAGNHKPGSGSAAALNGILSCKLLLTVIELTLEPKRKKRYSHCTKEFNIIKQKIENRIGKRLEELFEEDSKQFDKAIQKRIERDNEQNQVIKNKLNEEALLELKMSTVLPVEIAELCIELASYAIIVFEKGFKAARGDSGVALSSSLSGLTGCLSIISLNLQSFPKSHWTDKINIQKKELRKKFELLNLENIKLIDILDEEAELHNEFLSEINDLKKLCFGKTKLKNTEIEGLARKIQNTLWKYQKIIWPNNTPSSLLDVLKPEKVITLLKYAFHKVDTLGVSTSNEEIAGIINNKNFTIQISEMYAPEVINFTTAHELGHALIHDRIELHRDIPLDGSEIFKTRPNEEIQADKFAAYFLMPGKTVKLLFQEFFIDQQFEINEETSFMLANCTSTELRKKIHNKRDLSRMIAKCEFYNYKPFNSMASIFKVSVEAMAIRLEELNLVKY